MTESTNTSRVERAREGIGTFLGRFKRSPREPVTSKKDIELQEKSSTQEASKVRTPETNAISREPTCTGDATGGGSSLQSRLNGCCEGAFCCCRSGETEGTEAPEAAQETPEPDGCCGCICNTLCAFFCGCCDCCGCCTTEPEEPESGAMNNVCEEGEETAPPPATCCGRLNLLAATLLLGCVAGLVEHRDSALYYMFGDDVPGNITQTEGTLFAIFSVVSGTLTLLIGYRWVSVIGGAVMALGVLVSSFFEPTDINSFAFFYGVLPGIGRNMIVVPATIVVLEYSKKYGEKNLLVSESGIITISSTMVLIHTWVVETVWDTEWKNYLYLQTALAVMMAAVSLALRPLDAPEVNADAETPNEGTALSADEEASKVGTVASAGGDAAKIGPADGNVSKVRSIVTRILDYSSLSIYKKPFLYTFGFMWFFWDGGQAIIDYSFDAVETYADIRSSAPMVRLVSLLGPGALFILLKTRGLNLLNLCIVIVVSCACIGLPSFLASQLDNRGFTIFYAALVGFLKGAGDTALLYTTQLVVGEDHLAIGTGVLVLGQGLGIVTMTTAAGELYQASDQVDGGLYLTGVLLLLGAGVTLVTFFLVRRHAS